MNLPPTAHNTKRTSLHAGCLRSEEAHAGELLETLLRGDGHCCVQWSPGEDPPDLDFTVDRERRAVEVTHVDQQLIMSGKGISGSVQSRRNWSQKYRALGEEIQKAVQGHLRSRGGGDLALEPAGRGNVTDFGSGGSFSFTMMPPLDGPGGPLSTNITVSQYASSRKRSIASIPS
jgi:hypothetical protein